MSPNDNELAERLARRPAVSLAQFIVSLRFAPNPVGEHIRTFLLAEDLPATAASIAARLEHFADLSARRPTRSSRSSPIAATLEYLLDDIEFIVRPDDQRQAFALLVRFLECDAAASERSLDEDFEIQRVYRRAVAILTDTAKVVPDEDRKLASAQLLSTDSYELRKGVREALNDSGPISY